MSINLIKREIKRLLPDFIGDGFIEEVDLPALREIIIETLLNIEPNIDPDLATKVLCDFLRPMGNKGPIYLVELVKPRNKKEEGINALLLFEEKTDTTSQVAPEKVIELNAKKYEPLEEIALYEKQTPVAIPIPKEYSKLVDHVEKLKKIPQPEQRTKEWFAMRERMITASDIACAIGENHHEPQYKMILKKCGILPFVENEHCYNGKKYETIASMLYEIRYDVQLLVFGLLPHPSCKFLGASPDNIASHYTLNNKFSNLIGRMIEIKCPTLRNINTEGDIDGDQCPHYYWIQVQIQLACCDLEECDFWQCKIEEYASREEFLEDTDETNKWQSKETQLEKGCLIQIIPKDKVTTPNAEWGHAKFIYPPKIRMTPQECNTWIAKELATLHEKEEYNNYVLDRVIYWKIVKTACCLIPRDRTWYTETLPSIEKMWNYILFFRANKDMLVLLDRYINSLGKKFNKDIMQVVEKMYTQKQACKKEIEELIKNPTAKSIIKPKPKLNPMEAYGFIDTEEDEALA